MINRDYPVTLFFAKITFAVIALIGCISIILLKSIFVSHTVTWLVVVFSCSLIVIYAVVMRMFAKEIVMPEQVGDNCYYMGFLFTISSLVAALILFNEEDIDPKMILSSFGIGLSTTVVGIICRIWLSHVPANAEEIYKVNYDNLASSAKDLSSELLRAQNSFQDLSMKLCQSAQEINNRLVQTMDECKAQMNVVTKKTVEHLEDVSSKIDALNIPDSLFTERVDDMFKDVNLGMKRVVEFSDNFYDSIVNLERISTSLSNHINQIDKSFEHLEDAFSKTEVTKNDVEKIGASISEFSDSMQRLTSKTDEVTESQNEMLMKIKDFNSEYEKSMKRSKETLTETADTITSLIKTSIEVLKK